MQSHATRTRTPTPASTPTLQPHTHIVLTLGVFVHGLEKLQEVVDTSRPDFCLIVFYILVNIRTSQKLEHYESCKRATRGG